MALVRAAAESALRSLLGSLDLPATSKSVAPFRFASAMAWSGSCSLKVGVREEQPHLREEPPHVEVVGLLHHELGELQRAGADLDGLERLHEGQEPLRVVDLELKVRHGALAHGPLKLGRVHVGVRVPEVSFTTFLATTLPAVLSCLRSLCLSSMKPAIKGLQAKR